MAKIEKTINKKIEGLFIQRPKVKYLYEDEKGNFWTSENTAEEQCKATGIVTKHKRTDYIKTNKTDK